MWPDDYARRHPLTRTCDRCKRDIPATEARVIWGHWLCLDCAVVAERAIRELLEKLMLSDDEFNAWVEQECTPPGDLPEWAA
jgi:hypothetical protein